MVVGPAILAVLCAAPLPSRSVADVDDVYALEYNPAGLALLRSPELRLVVGGHFEGSRADLGIFGGVRLFDAVTVAAGLEVDDMSGSSPTRRFHFGLGAEVAFISVGAAVAEGRNGPSWKLGMTARPARWLSLSLAGLDLAQKDGRRRYDVGLALRPFGERFSAAVRWRLLQGLGISHDDGRPALEGRIEAELTDGLWVAATADMRLRLGLQLSLQMPTLLASAYVHTDVDAERIGTLTAELGLHDRQEPAVLRPTQLAVVHLAGELMPEPSFSLLALGFDEPTYGAVPLGLAIIADEPHYDGALIHIGALEIGWGRAEELRDEILRIRASGKRVDCQLTGSDDLAYFVASACDGITTPPPVVLNVDGIAATRTFFAEGLSRYGIDVFAEAAGKYKSAPEQFTRSGMSSEQAEALGTVLDRFYGRLVEAVSDGRQLKVERVKALLDDGVQTATEAKSLGMVDAVLYPDELERWLRQKHGGPVRFTVGATRIRRPRWTRPSKIGVIPIDAAISGGESDKLPFGLGRSVGAMDILRALDTAGRDPAIRAVILRIDSPGGDATASDLIARAVKRLAMRKPVIASFGDVAASGGYYVAAPATAIFAEPNTITGSIGVYAMTVSAERLLSQLGVSSTVLTRGENAERGGLLVRPAAAARAAAAEEVGVAYRQFLRVVAEGRKMTVAQVHELAQGRIWTGYDAHAKGLVDQIGGLPAAVRYARRAAHLAPDAPVDLVLLPSARTGWSDSVRRALGDTGPDVSALVPLALRRTLGAVMVGGGRAARPMALMPMVLQFD